MKRLFLILLTFMSLNVFAQIQVKEGSFKKIEGYLFLDRHDHTDMNNAPMALIKISTENISAEQRRKFTFKGGNLITYVDGPYFEPGEMLLYISAQAAESLEILHDDYGKTEFVFPYDLCDFCGYEMVVQYVVPEAELTYNYLIVKSDQPEARIFIDDSLVGKQFSNERFAVGSTHTWRVECDLYRHEKGEVKITSDKNEVDIKMIPEYGFISLTSTPDGAKVYIDDKYIGTTPLKSDKLNVGTRIVRVEKDEYQTTDREVVVNDKQTTTANINMLSVYVDVTINTSADADIYIDNELKGKGRWTGKVAYGTRNIEARKENHRTIAQKVELIIGEKKTITLDTPTPIYGMLDVNSTPSTAEVYIDGKHCGQTPCSVKQILIGNHELKLEKQGCAPLVKNIVVKENETLMVNEKLQTDKAIAISTDKPGDKIYVDDKYIGISPLTANLSYDKHIVKAKRGDKEVTKTITVSQNVENSIKLGFSEVNGHEYVDLGLSVKWATCNVGAETPEGYGDYFAWGETEAISRYSESNGKARYNKKLDNIGGIPQYDAATANWGEGWRLPTEDELKELISRCTWKKTKQNGVKGYMVIGPNGNGIFLPYAGRIDSYFRYAGEKGYYLSSTRELSHEGKYLEGLNFTTKEKDVKYVRIEYGSSIRPVVTKENESVVAYKQVETGQNNGHAYVDLGLPSSLQWATCNVGARSPEDYGDYFAWGETETKDEYEDENCVMCGKDIKDITNQSKYDPARSRWGEGWRLPKITELEELAKECTWEWMTLNSTNGGVNGYLVTGPNGNSIFFPAAGYRSGECFFDIGREGNYMSGISAGYPNGYAYGMEFDNSKQELETIGRSYGISVRPVFVGNEFVEPKR